MPLSVLKGRIVAMKFPAVSAQFFSLKREGDFTNT